MTKNESGDSSDEFRDEDQSQKHGILQRIKTQRISHRIKQDPNVDQLLLKRTSFSIQGRPLQVAKQPKSPKSMMATPVPVRTYGPLEGLLEISSM